MNVRGKNNEAPVAGARDTASSSLELVGRPNGIHVEEGDAAAHGVCLLAIIQPVAAAHPCKAWVDR